jgi:hypothetical protein
MTPRQKAKELTQKFEEYVRRFNEDEPRLDCMKECALIVCDEMINDWVIRFKELIEERKLKLTLDEMIERSNAIKFYNEVKQEIKQI